MERSLVLLEQLRNEVAALPAASVIKKPIKPMIKDNLPVSQSSPNHEKFLKHDMEIVENMLKITKKFLNNPPNNFRELLINLGQLAFNIKHDERDPNCIRNKFSDYSGLKGKPREDRHCVYGIPFEGLFYISKWFEKDKNICRNPEVWAVFYQKEFILLNQKLSILPKGELDKNVLENIQKLSECANDLLHLEIVRNTLEAFNTELDLEVPTSRYAIARIYSILGESAKSLSNTFHDADCLKFIFKKFGKCRDLVKLPFIMPKTAKRMQEAQKFLLSYKVGLEYFFTMIRDAIYDELNKNELAFICNYRTFLKSEIAKQIELFPLVDAEVDIQKVILNFRTAKNAEQNAAPTSDTESDDESDNEDEKHVVEKKVKMAGIESAVNLIEGYQKTNTLYEKAKEEYDAVEKKDDSVLSKQQKNHIKILKKKVETALRNKNTSFEKYVELRKILIENYPNLPNPNHAELMACNPNIFSIEPKTNTKKEKIPQSKLLVRYLSSVEDIYEQIRAIDSKTSPVMHFAFDQCVSFLGQLFREIDGLHRLVLHEPTFSMWNQDFSQTIKIRNQRLMHTVVNYDAQEVTGFVNESVLPWYDNFKAFSFIAKHHEFMESSKDIYSKIPLNFDVFNYLGLSYIRLHQWQDAERYLKLAYEACKDQINDFPACVMHNLADVYRAKGDWESATHWVKLAWEHRKKHLTSTHKYYVSTLIHLGMCFEQLVQITDALACYNNALEICEKQNLDQKQVLHCLGNFYAVQMNYPLAFSNYEKLLIICEDKVQRLYLLSSLETTAIECGQHDQALLYYEDMKKLFQENRAYFKSTLARDYLSFQKKMIGPVYILDLIGKSAEALELLNQASSISYEDKVLKLRLLRNLDRYQDVKELAEELLSTKESVTLVNKEHTFNCKIFYAQALIHLGDTKSSISMLEELCNEATVMKAQEGNQIVQMLFSPFNTICAHLIREKQYDRAKFYIEKAISFLKNTTLLYLSQEIFITLVNFYKVHLLANDINAIDVQMSAYEPLIFEYLKRSHHKKMYEMLDEFIFLLIEAKQFDTANKVLLELVKNTESSHHNFLMQYLHLFNCLMESGNINVGVTVLDYYLKTYCKDADKSLCSFVFADSLCRVKQLDLLCQVFDTYQSCWNDRLASTSIPVFEIFKKISNLSFFCFKFKGDARKFNEAIKYAHICISLARKIYTLLNEENPKDVLQFQEELFRQYWRIPMAIAEFKNYQQEEFKSAFQIFLNMIATQNPQIVSKENAEKINILYFSGNLNITNNIDNPETVMISMPSNWKKFLSALNKYIPTIMRLGSLAIKPLEMDNGTMKNLLSLPKHREQSEQARREHEGTPLHVRLSPLGPTADPSDGMDTSDSSIRQDPALERTRREAKEAKEVGLQLPDYERSKQQGAGLKTASLSLPSVPAQDKECSRKIKDLITLKVVNEILENFEIWRDYVPLESEQKEVVEQLFNKFKDADCNSEEDLKKIKNAVRASVKEKKAFEAEAEDIIEAIVSKLAEIMREERQRTLTKKLRE